MRKKYIASRGKRILNKNFRPCGAEHKETYKITVFQINVTWGRGSHVRLHDAKYKLSNPDNSKDSSWNGLIHSPERRGLLWSSFSLLQLYGCGLEAFQGDYF